MSLQPTGATKSIGRQDRAEYALQRGFLEVYKTLPADARRDFGINKMKEIREQMGVDYSRKGLSTADFRRLSELLPANTSFDTARTMLNQARTIEAWVKSSSATYSEMASAGYYPVPFLDNQLQAVPGIGGVTSFNTVTQGRPIRSLELGQALPITRYGGKRHGELVYDGSSEPTNQTEANNPFAASVSDNTPQTEQATQATQSAQVEEDIDVSFDDEMKNSRETYFTGWTSQPNIEEPVLGLDYIIGAYFTQNDQEKLRNHFDGGKLDIEGRNAYYLENSVQMLQYLRSNGIEFSVERFERDGQIDVRLEGYDMSVRIFDLDDTHPGRYIGRLYNSEGIVHIQNRQENLQTDYSPEESLLPLQVMMGHVNGEFQKVASSPNTQVHNVEGLGRGKHIFIDRRRHSNRYNAIEFRNDSDAVEFLETAIEGAESYFDKQFKYETLKDAILTDLASEDGESNLVDDLDDKYSYDTKIRMKQEAFIDDVRIAIDLVDSGYYEDIENMFKTVDGATLDLSSVENTPEAVADYMYSQVLASSVGSYDDGFNTSFVIEHAPEDSYRQNTREAVMAALRHLDYDLDKIKGNDFATQNIKDTLITFNEETARSIDDVDDPFLKKAMQRVQDGLHETGVVSTAKDRAVKPDVFIDDQGVIRWEGHRTIYQNPNRKTKVRYNVEELADGHRIEKQMISGEIGQIFAPNEHGIINTNFGSGENYGLIPGYTGYFKFDGEYSDDRMERFRVKGYEQYLNEKIDTTLRSQTSRLLPDGRENISHNFESTSLNGLYHGDVYGRRVDLDFVDKSKLDPETTAAIIKTLGSRVKFESQYGDHATTHAEVRAEMDTQHSNSSAFSYYKVSGETNMRVLDDDLANIADLTMTGNARNQGVTWYLVDGASVNEDGSVNKSVGVMKPDGTIEPDRTSVMKLKYFDYDAYNAWSRNQMSANQVMTAEHVAEHVGVAMMPFGGWTNEDSVPVSKDFADRYQVQGENPTEESMDRLHDLLDTLESESNTLTKEEILADTPMIWSDDVLAEGRRLYRGTLQEDGSYDDKGVKAYDKFLEKHGTFRPLQRGDKLSDAHGNKVTIGIVIDRNMSLKEAKEQDLLREVEIMKANPNLDIVFAPYPLLSRLNAGSVHELQDGEVEDVVIPFENNGDGEVLPGAMGYMNIIVTDLTVDKKTHAYTEADVAEGKGRLASGQYSWALESHGAEGILHEIYGRNDAAWATFREYLIATGLDMDPEGYISKGYTPHDFTEIRTELDIDDYESPDEFLNEITDKGGFLNIPFEIELKSGVKTNQVPILSAALRQDTELVDGSMRKSQFNNYYSNMFKHIKEYDALMDSEPLDDPVEEQKRQTEMAKAKEGAQLYIDKAQTDIIDRQFDGGSNGKHSFIRDKIMGKRMRHSATGVAIGDPRLEIGVASMDTAMMDAMNLNEGDYFPLHRDPVWRKAAVDGRMAILDDSVHGFGVNPITMGQKDGDLDGDTLGGIFLNTKLARMELQTKLAQHNMLTDDGTSKGDLFLPGDQDIATAHAVAKEKGDTRLDDLREAIEEKAHSEDENVRKDAVKDINAYVKIAFREHGYGGDYINLTSAETHFASLEQIVERGAKGSMAKLAEYARYYNGEVTRDDIKGIQYAKGVQTDDTGLGGAVSQRLVSAMRNQGIDPALEVTYPVTQGILQIKHDPKHAKIVDGLLRNEIANLYKGKSSDGKSDKVSKESWAKDYHKVLTEKMGVDVNKELVDKVADVMVDDKGKYIRNITQVIDEVGSPMDQVAYGGGFDKLVDLADNNRSMLEGRANRNFAPEKMRTGEAQIISKSDVRNKAVEKEVKDAYEEGVKRNADKPVTAAGKRNFKKDLDEYKSQKETAVVTAEKTSLDVDDGLSL